MENYKIKVNNEAESKEAQELFFELGYYWVTGLGVKNLDAKFLYAKNNQITMGYCSDNFSDNGCCELTLPQLRDLVVLHRNDVKDANYKSKALSDGFYFKTSDGDFYLMFENKWTKSSINTDEGLIKIEPEQSLISGADALRAIADGKEVEYKTRANNWNLINKDDAYAFSLFLDDDSSFSFRLKPRTIKLEIEIPAPFEPKEGDEIWFLNPDYGCGYADGDYDPAESVIQFGVWRTEEEIKQVVAALREAIKLG